MSLAERLQYWQQEEGVDLDEWRARWQAKTAFLLIRGLLDRPAEDRAGYLARCEQLPWMLRRSGLAKTLGRLKALQEEAALKTAGAETPEYELLADLALGLWPYLVRFEVENTPEIAPAGEPAELVGQLLDRVQRADLPDYLLLTRLTLTLCAEFKHFAQMFLKRADTGGEARP